MINRLDKSLPEIRRNQAAEPAQTLAEYLAAGEALRTSPIPAPAPKAPALPTPLDGALALNELYESLVVALGTQAVALQPLLGAVHRSLEKLISSYPHELARPELRGFSIKPARTLDELDLLLNRIEDVLLGLLPLEAQK